MRPITALKNTAVKAKIVDCRTTIQKMSRVKRKVKLPNPMNLVCALFSVER